jgi:ABC-type Zn uptake system ZnuABC Zn-binding protein ZnuA
MFSGSTSLWAGYHHKWTIFPKRPGIKVATSLPQLAEITKHIGGKHVSVVSLLKSDKDTQNPKLYHSMIKAVKEADVLLRLSSTLDPYIEDLVIKTGKTRFMPESEHCYSCLKTSLPPQDLNSLLADKSNQEAIAQVVLSALINESPKFENDFRVQYQAYLHSLQAESGKKQ